MKHIFTSTFVFICCISAIAQNEDNRIFKPFKVDMSLGGALPINGTGNARGGGISSIEPKYAITDQFALGLRMEMAMLGRFITNNQDRYGEGDLLANSSYLFTGDYYFNNQKCRPFMGAGAGLYQIVGAILNDNISFESIFFANKFGGMVRSGFEAGHFRLGAEYNLIPKTRLSQHNHYIGFKVGFCIGGGRYEQ
ncbi:MAG TPA: hypothetical protein VLC98_00290 [Phnomibacter sp.]|nr:hypothetical protein [Phnomibacter sp.]